MNHPMLFQLNMARDWCIEVAKSCPKELSDTKVDLFNNTIQWHVGHILTVAERMMFNFPEKSTFLSHNFTKWFESGTAPKDWIESPPGLEDLITLLKEQQTRLLSIPNEHFENQFEKPFFGFINYSECASFVAIHETLHVGKMEEMIRVLQSLR